MSGGVNKPGGIGGFAIPILLTRPVDDGGVLSDDPSAMPSRYVLDEAAPRSLEQRPVQHLLQNLGVLRGRIVSDPTGEGAQETMERYWARVEMTTLSDVLLAESRIWQKHMEAGSLALKRIAVGAYYRVVQHKNYFMRISELFRGSDDLRARIAQDDFDSSREALIIYQGFVGTFFRSRPDLIAMEVSGFRTMAEMKIRRVLSENQTKNIDADVISHLDNLLAVYAQIVFYNGIDSIEIEDGIKWVEAYMQEGHVLEKCAQEVRASLNMTRDLLEGKKDPPDQGDSTPDGSGSNDLPSVSGEIVASESGVRVGKVPYSNTPKVIVQGSIQLFGLRLKPA